MEFLKQLNILTWLLYDPVILLLDIYSREMSVHVHKTSYTSMLIAAIFINTKN